MLIGCSKSTLNKVIWSQQVVMLCIALFNFILYSPILALVSLKPVYSNTSTLQQDDFRCKFDDSSEWIINLIDLINFSLVPFSLMLIFSLLMIITIFKSRLRILRLTNVNDKNRLKKDIKFAVTSIILNLFFILFNLPICIENLIQFDNPYISDINFCFFLSNFCNNFYVFILSNSIFRYEVLSLFNLK